MTLDPAFLAVVVGILALSVALNFVLTLRLAAIVREHAQDRLPNSLPIGMPLPAFSARAVDGTPVASSTLRGAPAVLVFLSPGCGECKARREELIDMHPAIRRAGIALWVFVNAKPAQAREYLRDTPLAPHAMRIDKAVAEQLNPRTAAPFYLFVDPDGRVIASQFAGDADWRSFREQMREYDAPVDGAGEAAAVTVDDTAA